jgi:hypothetical protein
MAESENTGNRKSFQIINEIDLLDVERIKEVYFYEKLLQDDPYLLRALGKKLEKIRSVFNLQAVHAISCGINCDLFILNNNSNFRIFYKCSYSGLDEKISSIESCYFCKKLDGTFRNYICSRYKKIFVCGYEVTVDFEPIFQQFEQTYTDVEACIIQQQVDIQNQTFLPDYAEEIEVKSNATF